MKTIIHINDDGNPLICGHGNCQSLLFLQFKNHTKCIECKEIYPIESGHIYIEIKSEIDKILYGID